MRTWMLVFASLTLCTGAISATQQERFPHGRHARVFPLCTGCHAGIEGSQGARYPAANDCRNCHDGSSEEVVTWDGPAERSSNLRFDHRRHLSAVAAEGQATRCTSCHQVGSRGGAMDVGAASPENCLACHENASSTHLDVGANCAQCHVPVVEAVSLDRQRISEFPRPATHESADFLETHGKTDRAQLTCSTCHARESCDRCHLNGESIPVIAALGSDSRVAAIVAPLTPEYPTPTSHRDHSWAWSHADTALSQPMGCANCHSQSSCRECHRGAELTAVETLPQATASEQRGVVFEDPPTVHAPGFEFGHGAAATVDDQTCLTCHTAQENCLECHQGQGQPEFHLPNFRERHAVEAYGMQGECASCHSLEVFCRNCHIGSGIASEGSLNTAFHDSRPLWLLGHAQAARQGLESCTTCHSQSDCMQCHSALGAWRINPHGPDFDGTRAQSRNRLACLACHRTEPPGGDR